MKLYSLETGNFKLDGGAMFGVVPKSLWNKVYPSDENNMCNLSLRCLLIEDGKRLILIDTGLGNKQSSKFFGYYFLNGDATLDRSLDLVGYSKSDITDVLLTHLHFDHCGGAVIKNEEGILHPAFPNAEYWVSDAQWHWALDPNQREKASYLHENFKPVEKAGRLNFINTEINFTENIRILLFHGHTAGLLVPVIHVENMDIVYVGDLIPTAAHLPLSWVCGFDTRPLISMNERKKFLEEAVKKNYILFFEHDILRECCSLVEEEKGIMMKKEFTLKSFLG